MKTLLKQFLSKISNWFIFWIGFILSIWLFSIIYAAFTWTTQTPVSSGSPLTSAIWNDMINNMSYLKENVETKLVTNWNGSALTWLTKTQVWLWNVDNTADASKNVLSATKLTTARTINWVSFNWTANITLPSTFTPVYFNTTVNRASNLWYAVEESRNCDLFCRVVKWYSHWLASKIARANNGASNICACFN